MLKFSGADPDTDAARHKIEQNLDDMTGALNRLDGAANVSDITLRGGSSAALLDAVDALCEGLDDDTQLVLYFTGHGDLELDLFELFGWAVPRLIDATALPLTLPAGLLQGLLRNLEQGDPASCALDFVLAAPIQGEEWTVRMNGCAIPVPPGPHSGAWSLPVPWQVLRSGENLLEIAPAGVPGAPMELDALELSSGPVHEHHPGTPLAMAPTAPAAGGWLRCRPNPAGRSASIEYFLPGAGAVRLTVCDVAGRVLRCLADESQDAGAHAVRWDGRLGDGARAPAGSYFVRLEAGGRVCATRIVRVR